MADYAKGKQASAPPDLAFYWQCKQWSALPRNGGMNSQDYKQMKRLETVGMVYDVVKAWRAGRLADTQRKVLHWLVSAGVM